MNNKFNLLTIKVWIILFTIIGYGNLVYSLTQLSRDTLFWSLLNMFFPIQIILAMLLISVIQFGLIKKIHTIENNQLHVLVIGVVPAVAVIMIISAIPFLSGGSLEFLGYTFVSMAASLSYLINQDEERRMLLYVIYFALTVS